MLGLDFLNLPFHLILSLKNFADRVIWMRDGKIQSVEQVGYNTKSERKQQLKAEYKVVFP